MSVVGGAGIGKSRFAWEFHKYIDGITENIYWHQGRSPAYGEGITFWALGEMVRKRAGLAESDDHDTTRAGIAASLAEYVPDAEERRWIEPRLLQLLGVEEIRPSEREELFAAWRTFFERVADLGPTILLFEDIHWADPGLFDFIDHILEWSRSHPILIVTLARPELLERRPDWGAGRRNFVSIDLEPLPDDAMMAGLEGLVPGLPAAAVALIVERAEGVPLYAVETVRMLLQDGRIAEEGGTYRPVGDLTDLRVPETLHALIAARLDTLEPGRARARPAWRGPRPQLHARGAGRGQRRARSRPRPAPALARAARDLQPQRRPAIARAGPVRVRAPPHPRGRIRDALEARSADAPPRRGALLRGAR